MPTQHIVAQMRIAYLELFVRKNKYQVEYLLTHNAKTSHQTLLLVLHPTEIAVVFFFEKNKFEHVKKINTKKTLFIRILCKNIPREQKMLRRMVLCFFKRLVQSMPSKFILLYQPNRICHYNICSFADVLL